MNSRSTSNNSDILNPRSADSECQNGQLQEQLRDYEAPRQRKRSKDGETPKNGEFNNNVSDQVLTSAQPQEVAERIINKQPTSHYSSSWGNDENERETENRLRGRSKIYDEPPSMAILVTDLSASDWKVRRAAERFLDAIFVKTILRQVVMSLVCTVGHFPC